MFHNKLKIGAICLQFAFFIAHAAETDLSPAPETAMGCDSTKNSVTWLKSDLECSSDKAQVSLLANISKQDVKRSQFSLLANIAMKDVERLQLSGALNYARHVRGAQISWDINIAKTVTGFQLGALNIADTVKGAQIGSINIADHIEGVGIGFLTVTKNGLLHWDLSAEETGMEKLTFASGKTFFTSYSLGYSLLNKSHPYSFGMGFGYNKAFSKTFVEAELHGSLILDRYTKLKNADMHKGDIENSDWRFNHLMQLKLRMGQQCYRNLGVFGGLTYNVLATHNHDRLLGSADEIFTSHSKDFYGWPGVEIGIRLGR